MSILNSVSSGNRTHIGFFGRVNSGKSSLVNRISKQDVSLVSNLMGTTTDPVYKAMEIKNLGACVLMDTPGIDDISSLSELRIKRTKEVIAKTDIAVVLITPGDFSYEDELLKLLNNKEVFKVLNKADILKEEDIKKVKEKYPDVLLISAETGEGIEKLLDKLVSDAPKESKDIFGTAITKKDIVLLVIPQDIGAPKGRLILPQVQSIRELLDKNAIVISVKTTEYIDALNTLKYPPKLIITDSSVFKEVYKNKPASSKLTSFSILFAKLKGDLEEYLKGINAIYNLNKNSKVLIAECCTHAPQHEDIGRVKIPAILKNRFDVEDVEVIGGEKLPDDLSKYDLIIQCGGCMLNRSAILNRIDSAVKLKIPITNYGMFFADAFGILDMIDFLE